MNCDQARDLLPIYVAGDAGDDAQAVADHLATCAGCAAEEAAIRRLADELRQAGDAFRPRLLPPELNLAHAATQARRRRFGLLAFACCAGVLAAMVVALAVPSATRRVPLPAGQQLRRLDDRVAGLTAALSAARGELTKVNTELALRRRVGRSVILPVAGVRARRESRLLRPVAAFFAAKASAAMPGQAGRQARLKLAQVTAPGSPVASGLTTLPLASPTPSLPGARLSGSGTVVVVSRIKMLARTRALVYVRVFDYRVWTTTRTTSAAKKRTRTDWIESVHRIVVVRAAGGRWLVANDLSSAQPPASAAAPAATQLASGPSPSASPGGNLGVSGPTPPTLGSPTASPAPAPTAPAPTPTASGASP